MELRGYIDKEKILSVVSEEQIFSLVFGYVPEEFDRVVAPYREDSNPGCWFERNDYGSLQLRDFGYGTKPLDCFDVVRLTYGHNNFFEVLAFVHEHLIQGKDLKPLEKKIIPKKEMKDKKLYFKPRDFIIKDKYFWERYEITKEQLMEDLVFPVSHFMMLNTRNGDIKTEVNDIGYAYTDFQENRKKLYFPNRKGSNRFVSICNKNDIGSVSSLQYSSDTLWITKSYKDCRVLRNQGLESIWIQNEGMIPDREVLTPIVDRYKFIVVWYDNDDTGITASIEMAKFIQRVSAIPVVYPVNISVKLNVLGIKDPSDLLYKRSKEDLNKFIEHVKQNT